MTRRFPLLRAARALLLGMILTSSLDPVLAAVVQITVKDGGGVSRNINVTTNSDATGNLDWNNVICDQSAGTTCASVGTAGSPSTNALTVQPVTLGNGTSANAARVTISNDSTGTVAVTNTGTFATQATQAGTWNVTVNTALPAGSNQIGTINPATPATWGLAATTQNVAAPTNGMAVLGEFTTTPTTISSGNFSPLQMDNAGNLLVNIKAGAGSGGTALTDEGTFTQGGTSFTPSGCFFNSSVASLTSGQGGAFSCTNTRNLLTDITTGSQLHTDLNTINTSINNPTTMFSALALSSVTRPANTTTYTANTGWCTLTSSCVTTFSFTNVCRANGAEILIPQIDIWSSANPTTKLQGILWLFDAAIGTIISDDATFNIAAADFANLTGNQQGFPFTLASAQASGAANSGVSLTGTTYHAQCESGAQTILGMVQVVNAYVPASGEVLHVALHSVGVN